MLSMDVSVVVPFYNVDQYIAQCLHSILDQNHQNLNIEVSLFDDASTDSSYVIANHYKELFCKRSIGFILHRNTAQEPGGVAFAKNSAVKASSGKFLCFLDSDDFCQPDRVRLQHKVAIELSDLSIIGSQFQRIPESSTQRYTNWANRLSPVQLSTQIFTSNGPTIVAPTWFMSRRLFDAVGGFHETSDRGFPEDSDFFYRALRLGATLHRVDIPLVTYRYHIGCATFGISEHTIFEMRCKEFQNRILANSQNRKWQCFSIWNAGKAGRKFFRWLSEENRRKVKAFCDVDQKKIKQAFYEPYDQATRNSHGYKIPIISYKDVLKPVVICVKMDFTGGNLEQYIREKNWTEGDDYYYLS